MTNNCAAKKWTAGEDRVLREMYASTSVDRLCQLLGRSRRSVLGRITRIGLKRVTQHKWTAADLNYILEQRDIMPYSEIAEVLGVSLKALARAVERYGIYKYHLGLTEHEQRCFKNLHTRGYSDLKISRKLKLTKSRVLRHRLRIGAAGNGYTEKSWSTTDPSILRTKDRRWAAKTWGIRRVSLDELTDLAKQFTNDDEEMLAIAWAAMREAWSNNARISDMAIASKNGIDEFRRQTYSHLSLNGFVDENGKEIDISEDRRRFA